MNSDQGSPVQSRNLASFYTPVEVAQVLADWAIADADTTVLDPSFGGCAFLYASLKTLYRLGSSAPARQIYGVDIDPKARPHLQRLISASAKPDQFVISDFFSVAPDHFGDRLFGAVVGNPPYIRYHDIPNDARERAVMRLKDFNIQISKRASYWAFFLLYSMQFLRQGGRLALILPGAFLHTDYSIQVRKLLTEHFADVTIYLLQERVFDNTEEESVLVCASGARQPHQTLRIGGVDSVAHLEKAFRDMESSTRPIDDAQGDGDLLRGLLKAETVEVYDELVATPSIIRMGDLVKAHIGVVTGRNEYFILSPAEQQHRKIPDEFLIPIVRRASHLKGLWMEDGDLETLAQDGHKHLLLKIDRAKSLLPNSLQEYIEYGEEIGVSQAQKCRVRRPWYAVPRTFAPSAFMQCMSAFWPRLVVNRSEYTCTNNILRILWKEEEQSEEDWLRLALGTVSTLSQLSAELVGRSYGGGVLKVEPSELLNLAVPLIPADIAGDLADRVDSLLRQGNLLDATKAVDAALLESNTELNSKRLERLRAARNLLFLRRRQHRKDAQRLVRGSA